MSLTNNSKKLAHSNCDVHRQSLKMYSSKKFCDVDGLELQQIRTQGAAKVALGYWGNNTIDSCLSVSAQQTAASYSLRSSQPNLVI
jgi:hypothetical protein